MQLIKGGQSRTPDDVANDGTSLVMVWIMSAVAVGMIGLVYAALYFLGRCF
jgi:hypothetical protein